MIKSSFEEKVTTIIASALNDVDERVNSDSWKNIIDSIAWEIGTQIGLPWDTDPRLQGLFAKPSWPYNDQWGKEEEGEKKEKTPSGEST